MGIPFTMGMGFLLTMTMGKLFTMTLGIQLTISSNRSRHRGPARHRSQGPGRPPPDEHPLALENLETMDYLEFIARVTSHIPDKSQVMRNSGTWILSS